nr:calymmin isoform X3 [Nothobranchius furzeri]
MMGRLVFQSMMMLCFVQAAHTWGYSAAYGASSGPGPHPDGIRPQTGGGVGALLMPSIGVGQTLGPHNGYAGYPTKGIGYAAGAAGVSKGVGVKGGNYPVFPNGNRATSNGYGVKAGPTNGQQMNGYGAQAGGYGGQRTKGNGYGVISGPTNGQQVKGYGAQAAGYAGQRTKGNGNNVAAAAVQYGLGTKGNGYGAQAGGFGGQRIKGNGYGAHSGGFVGQRTKGNGYGVIAGPTNGQHMRGGYGAQLGGYGGQRTKGYGNAAAAGAQNGFATKGVVAGPSSSIGGQLNGQGEDGSKPMKGYGRPLPGAGMVIGPFRGVAAPQSARHQEKAYGGNGYNGYRAQNMGGSRGGYGAAGLGLGPRYGNMGLKGPVPGSAGARAPNGYGVVQNGHGNPSAAAAKPGFAKSGHGVKPNGHGGSTLRPQLGYGAAAAGVMKGYGAQANGHGAGTGAALGGSGGNSKGYGLSSASKPLTKGVGTLSQSEGYGTGNGKGQAVRGVDLSNGKSLKGGVFPSRQQVASPSQDIAHLTQGEVLVAPVPTSSLLGLVKNEKYQKQFLPQGKSYKAIGMIPEPTPGLAPALPDPRNPNAQTGPVALQNPVAEPAAVLSQETAKVSVSKKQGVKSAKPGNGGHAGAHLNGGGAKANKPGYQTFPGLFNGFGAGLGYPYGGKFMQPGFGAYLGAGNGYLNGNMGKGAKSKSGSVNGFNRGGQPDYAALGQSLPLADGQSEGTKQFPYNGAPVVPAGLDGTSPFEPHPAGLYPNGKSGSPHGVMGGLPFGGMSAENIKYGVGGLQYAGQPISVGMNGGGQYGYGVHPYVPAAGGLGASMGGDALNEKNGGFSYGGQLLGLGSNGNIPGKYGYGAYPYEAQPAGMTPETKPAGQYELPGSKGCFGAAQVPYGTQIFGFGGKTQSGKYDKQGAYQSQPLESATEGTAAVIYEPRLPGSDSAAKAYVKGEAPISVLAAEGERTAGNKYENMGYINGQVQPNVVAFRSAPTPSSTAVYSSVRGDSFTPAELIDDGVQDLTDPEDTGSLLESAATSETQDEIQVSEHPDDSEMPRQVHIQQHLKLHFHPQGGKKYDLNGFFGNSDHQG